MELSELQGVGKTRLEALHAAGIFSLRDLLYAIPLKYRDASAVRKVADVRAGERVVVRVRRTEGAVLQRYGKQCRVSCRFADESGEMSATWFGQQWMKQTLEKQTEFLLCGLAGVYRGRLQLVNPTCETELRIVPLYRPVPGLPQKTHEKLALQALPFATELCPETLPPSLCERYNLMAEAEAICQLHQPSDTQTLHRAQRRYAFAQFLRYQAAMRLIGSQAQPGYAMPCEDRLLSDFWHVVGFAPPGAQKRTLNEIHAEMANDGAMARMVQGDVGCGKTALAFAAMAICAKSGYQAALMAPTTILARQHLASAQQTLEKLGIRCGLLVGGLSARERREALANIETGAWQVVLGTHALISEGVKYHRLGLVVTDEQHRFGVAQRTRLLRKGGREQRVPHLLVMSATPIPRSLALVMFGDLAISVVDELPPGRTPVLTRIVPEEKRADMYSFLAAELRKGRQAYIVCPRVDEGDDGDELKAAVTHQHELMTGPLKGFAVGLVHGQQPPAEKAEALQQFARGETQVLVATTVIEVGVNVPAATMMIVESADRYGLAQLHQIRGRVGRGSEKSWCFLMAQPNERLRILTQTSNGFEIARRDLELRGPGELLGEKQHGADAALGDLPVLGDASLLHEAAACVEELATYPEHRTLWGQLGKEAVGTLRRLGERVSIS